MVLTNGHAPLDLIDHFLTASDQDWKIQGACVLYQDRLAVTQDDNLRTSFSSVMRRLTLHTQRDHDVPTDRSPSLRAITRKPAR
jgi:hypothetical protein